MKRFAEMAGDILSEALDKVFTSGDLPDGKLYQNIAEKVITPMLQQNHSLVNEVCGYVMDDKNAAAKIGVKAVTAGFNADRAEKIAQIAANSGGVKKGSKAAQLITNMSLSFVDEFIQANADLHKDLGMVPQIQRIYHGKPGGCGFCEDRIYSGEYRDPDMPEGIFQRHRDCKCTLIYEPQKGKYQDPWSKREASEYEQLVSDQRSYLTELDKMTPAERKLARNARARELRRSKYSASEWSERKTMQARMQRIKEKEVSLSAGGKAVRKEKQAEIAAKAAADKAARQARIIARVEELQKKRKGTGIFAKRAKGDIKAKNLDFETKKDIMRKSRKSLFDKEIFFGDDVDMFRAALGIETDKKYINVFSHGSSKGISIKVDGITAEYTPKEFAEIYREIAGEIDKPIKLHGCENGVGNDSFAQKLSEEIHGKVIAANGDVILRDDEGVAFVGYYGENTNDWRTFVDGKEVK